MSRSSVFDRAAFSTFAAKVMSLRIGRADSMIKKGHCQSDVFTPHHSEAEQLQRPVRRFFRQQVEDKSELFTSGPGCPFRQSVTTAK
jgi:hypothetical protein